MPAKDIYHDSVKTALVKDGWTITDDPFLIEYKDVLLKADLGAEKVFAAERNERKIVIEVKVFGGVSFFNDLHRATGQYCNYRALLSEAKPEHEIWLAVPVETFQSQFRRDAIKKIVSELRIKILVFDPGNEEIVQWTN